MTLHSKLQMKKHARACWLLVANEKTCQSVLVIGANNQHALACFFICSLECSVIFVTASDAGESPKQSCQAIKDEPITWILVIFYIYIYIYIYIYKEIINK